MGVGTVDCVMKDTEKLISSTLVEVKQLSRDHKKYSWIGRYVRTHKKSICRETKKATTDLKLRTKALIEVHPLVRGTILYLIFLESYS